MPSVAPRPFARLARLELGLLLCGAVSACSLDEDSTGALAPGSDVLPVTPVTPATDDDGNDEPPKVRDAQPQERADAGATPGRPAPVRSLDSGVARGSDAAVRGVMDASRPLDAQIATDSALPLPDASSSDAGPTAPGSCTAEGTYALRAEFNVSWMGTSIGEVIPVLAPGRGKIVIYANALLTSTAASKSSIEILPCGATIPEFIAGNPAFVSEVYGAYIPDSAWDQPTMPHFFAQSEFGCLLPGCSFTTGRIDPLLGAPLNSSSTSFWNANVRNPNAPIDARDDDADGEPGITLSMRGPETLSAQGKPYSYPPLGAISIARARRIMLSMGVRGRFVGMLNTCDEISGQLMDGEVRTRAVGCTAFRPSSGTEVATSMDFVRFLDDNLPQWQFESGTFRAVRLANPTCSTVRAAFD